MHAAAADFAQPLPNDNGKTYPELAVVVKLWPELPEAVRAGIVAMVQAAAPSDDRQGEQSAGRGGRS